MKQTAYTNIEEIILFDKKSGGGKQYLCVNHDGKISDVGYMSDFKGKYDKVIDCSNCYMMPGLINAHVHLFLTGKAIKDMAKGPSKLALKLIGSSIGKMYFSMLYKKNLEKLVRSGVTSVRDMGSAFYLDLTMRDKIKNNKIIGPRVIASGPIITPTGGHGAIIPTTIIADGKDAFRQAVRHNFEKGVDSIKICNTGGVSDSKFVGEAGMVFMAREEIEAVCEEAHRRNLLVATHCQSVEGMKDALLAGVDTIEHGCEIPDELLDLFQNNPKSLRGYSAMIPTLSAVLAFDEHKEELLENPNNHVAVTNAKMLEKSIISGLNTCIKEELSVGIGTDASMPFVTHDITYKELIYFKEHTSLSNEEILKIATIKTAEIINIGHETGSIEIGKSADLILLNKDPREDLNHLVKPKYVIANGRFIDNSSH